jgi:hypothetical protein
MTTKPALQKIFKGILTQKRKIITTLNRPEKINLPG